MTKIKVSIIVPVFNVEKYLKQCMDSLINQTLKEIEIICINDGSTDNSLSVLNDYGKLDKRVKVFSFINKGLGASRNRGIKLACGEYITFVDSDDWVELDFCEKAYNNAIKNNSDIVFCNAVEEYGDFKKDRIYFSKEEINSENFDVNYSFKKHRLINHYLTAWSKLIKTSFLKENNILFPEIIFEDGPFHVESILKAKNISYCNFFAYHYRKNNATSIMNSLGIGVFDVFIVVDKILNILKENGVFSDYEMDFIRFEITQYKEKFSSSKVIFKEKFFSMMKGKFLEFPVHENQLKLLPPYLSQFYKDVLSNSSYYAYTKTLKKEKDCVTNISKNFSFKNNIFIKYINLKNYKINGDIEKNILHKIENDLLNNYFLNLKGYESILNEGLFDYKFFEEENEFNYNFDYLLYYIYSGFEKGQNPTSFFDSKYFENTYSINHINPYIYYILYGRFEGKDKFNKEIQIRTVNRRLLDRKITLMNENNLLNNKNNNLIVSLTSFPERMSNISYTLYSLFDQSFKPDEIILCLSYEEFPNKEDDIPEAVLKFKEYGLKIIWYKNIKSYKKLIPILKEYPNEIIVTADDDVYYPKDWLKILWEEHNKHPNDIIAHRSRRISFDEAGNINSYDNWKLSYSNEDASFLNFFTGVGGVLYPPHALHEDVVNESIFNKNCPNADDIWFWVMALRKNTKIRVPENCNPYLTYINGLKDLNISNDKSLWDFNQYGGNDTQLKKIINVYPEILNKIK